MKPKSFHALMHQRLGSSKVHCSRHRKPYRSLQSTSQLEVEKKSQLPVPTCTCGTCVRCIFYLQIHTKTCHVISRLWHIMASRCLMHIFNNCLRRPYISSPKTATSCVFMLAAPLCHRLVQQSCCTCVQCVRFS